MNKEQFIIKIIGISSISLLMACLIMFTDSGTPFLTLLSFVAICCIANHKSKSK